MPIPVARLKKVLVFMGDKRSSFDHGDLLACGRGELFGPGNAQLPLPPMLMFDRIVEIAEEGGANGKGADPGRARRERRTSGSSPAISRAIP